MSLSRSHPPTELFREVELPSLSGRLFLHKMPGSEKEPLAACIAEIEKLHIDQIVCLAPPDDICRKSPEYAKAMGEGDLPCDVIVYPLVDFNLPKNREAFGAFADYVAARLRRGANLLMHCEAGIGRTGTFACCVLLSLGVAEDEAKRRVEHSGSGYETQAQDELIGWWARTIQTPS